MNSENFYEFCKNGDLYNAKLFLSNKNRIILKDSYLFAACESENLELIKLILNDDRIDCYYKSKNLFNYLISNNKQDIMNFLLFESNKSFIEKTFDNNILFLLSNFDFITNPNNEKFVFFIIDRHLNYFSKIEDYEDYYSCMHIFNYFIFDEALHFVKYIFEHEKFPTNFDDIDFLEYFIFIRIKNKNPKLNENNQVLNYLFNSPIPLKKVHIEKFIFSINGKTDEILNNSLYENDREYTINYILDLFEKMFNFKDYRSYIANFLNKEEIRINSTLNYSSDISDFINFLKKNRLSTYNKVLQEYNKAVIDKIDIF